MNTTLGTDRTVCCDDYEWVGFIAAIAFFWWAECCVNVIIAPLWITFQKSELYSHKQSTFIMHDLFDGTNLYPSLPMHVQSHACTVHGTSIVWSKDLSTKDGPKKLPFPIVFIHWELPRRGQPLYKGQNSKLFPNVLSFVRRFHCIREYKIYILVCCCQWTQLAGRQTECIQASLDTVMVVDRTVHAVRFMKRPYYSCFCNN